MGTQPILWELAVIEQTLPAAWAVTVDQLYGQSLSHRRKLDNRLVQRISVVILLHVRMRGDLGARHTVPLRA